MAPKKMARHIKSPLGYDWRRVQVRVRNKWEVVMDIEDDHRADEVVAPIQRAFDALTPAVVKCSLPGCGMELSPQQIKAGERARSKSSRKVPTFCSRECYHDYRKT